MSVSSPWNTQLNRDERTRRRVAHLGGGAHEAQFAGANLLAAGEHARDPVRLGDERAVDERERDARQDAGGGARGRRRLGDQRERGGVGERQAAEDDVAQLARRRLDDRRVVVAPEDRRDAGRRRQTEPGDRHRHHHRAVRPAQRPYLVQRARCARACVYITRLISSRLASFRHY